MADRKRTDIRLLAIKGGQKAVIEVKIGDKRWSLRALEKALENQLAGQYLRHADCKSGCLLLTYGRRKRWRQPRSGDWLDLAGALAFLQETARCPAGSDRLSNSAAGQ